MAHWSKYEAIIAGVCRNPEEKDQERSCYRCGKRMKIKELTEIGNEVYICALCAQRRK